jgi:hypothetical protein
MHVGAIINCLLKITQTGDLVTQFITHRHFTGDALTLKLRYIFTINYTFSCTLVYMRH